MFLYIGSFRCRHRSKIRAAPSRRRRAGAGRRNQLPIIYFSVQWWNSLHQARPSPQEFQDGASMLAAMLILLAACWIYSIAVVLVRVRCIIREREGEAPWLAEAAIG